MKDDLKDDPSCMVCRYLAFLSAVIAGTLLGVAMLIYRKYLGEFLIIFAVVGWSLSSLVLADEPHDHESWLQALEYLS